MRTITYRQARWLMLALGSVVLLTTTAGVWALGADLVEVFATLLFVPVLIALVLWRAPGGAVAGLLVSIVYVVVRLTSLGDLASEQVAEFTPSIVQHILLYLLFGVFGGVANSQVEQALRKLELYDEVDDLTGVGNARAALSFADKEVARSRRYQTIFSVSVVRVPREPLAAMPTRKADKALRNFYEAVDKSVRTTDRVARLPMDDDETVLIMMPETGAEGARIFTDRALPRMSDTLRDLGVPLNGRPVEADVLTVPGDEDRLGAELDRVRALVARDHLADEGTTE